MPLPRKIKRSLLYYTEKVAIFHLTLLHPFGVCEIASLGRRPHRVTVSRFVLILN